MGKVVKKLAIGAAIGGIIVATGGIGAGAFGGLTAGIGGVAAGLGVGLTATVAGAIAGGIVAGGFAALGAISKALGPSLADQQGLKEEIRSAVAPRIMVYGRTSLAGTMVYAGTHGTDNKYLTMVFVVAGHEIDAFEKFYFNDDLLTLDGSGNVTAPARYVGKAIIKTALGIDTQAAITGVAPAEWTTNHRLRGLAYYMVRLEADKDAFPNGRPQVRTVIRGAKVFDPRTSTTVWSLNPALILRDYLTRDPLGCRLPSGDVDDTAIIAAANVCDETVSLKAGGTQTRYEASGLMDTRRARNDNIAAVLSAMGGFLVYQGARFTAYAGADSEFAPATVTFDENDLRGGISVATRLPRTSRINRVRGQFIDPAIIAAANVCDENVSLKAGGTQTRYEASGLMDTRRARNDNIAAVLSAMGGFLVYQGARFTAYAGADSEFAPATVTFDENDLRGGISVATRLPRTSRINRVRGQFIDPANDLYEATDYPPVIDAAAETADGGEVLEQSLDLPFTTDGIRAQRLARLALGEARREITVTLPVNLKGLQVQALSTVKVTNARLGWTNKLFRVAGWQLSADGGVDLDLKEYDAAIYSWTPATDELAVVSPASPTIETGTTAPAVAGLSAVAGVTTGPNATKTPVIDVAFTAPTALVASTLIQMREAAGAWRMAGAVTDFTTPSRQLTGLEPGQTYEVRAAHITRFGLTGAFVTITGIAIAAASRTADDVVTVNTVPAADVAGQALVPSQNLLGPDAGPEHSGAQSIPYEYQGFVGTPSPMLIDTLGLAPGDVLSWSADFKSTTGTDGAWLLLRFEDNAGTLIAQFHNPSVNSATYQRGIMENIAIPAGAVRLRIVLQNNVQSETIFIRRAMVNRGPKALPFEEPPIRAAREDLTDLDSTRAIKLDGVAAGADVTGANKAQGIATPDTRNDNQPPSWYRASKGVVTEFKLRSIVGAPGAETYGILETKVPWSDDSGGAVSQIFRSADGEYRRTGTDAAGWTVWQTSFDAQNIPTDTSGIDGKDARVITGNIIHRFFDNFEYDSTAQFQGLVEFFNPSPGELSLVAGESGGQALRVGDNAGNDMAFWAYKSLFIPYNPAFLYRVRVRVRRILGTEPLLMGLTGWAADKTTKVSDTGVDTLSFGHFIGARNAAPPVADGVWYTVTGYVRGTGNPGSGTPKPDPQNPGIMHPNVRYVTPGVGLNSLAGAGQWELDWVEVVIVDGALGEVNTTLPSVINIDQGNNVAQSITRGSATVTVTDGQVVTFSPQRNSVPGIRFGTGGLEKPSGAIPGQWFKKFLAKTLSISGFTADVKLKAKASGTTAVTDTGAVAGGGGAPDFVIQKSNAGSDVSDTYRFQITASVPPPVDTNNDGFPDQFFSITLGFWVDASSGWVMKATRAYTVSGTNVESVVEAALGQHAGAEFGVSIEAQDSGASFTFDNVKYDVASSQTTETATPAGVSGVEVTILDGLGGV